MGRTSKADLDRINSPNGYCIAGAGQVFGGGGCKLFFQGTPDSLCSEPNGHPGTSAGDKQAATTWTKGRRSRVEGDGGAGRGLSLSDRGGAPILV